MSITAATTRTLVRTTARPTSPTTSSPMGASPIRLRVSTTIPDEESLWLRFVLPVTAVQAKAALGPLTLHVDGTAFAVSDSEVNEPDLVWSFDPDPVWADEQEVSLAADRTRSARQPEPRRPEGRGRPPEGDPYLGRRLRRGEGQDHRLRGPAGHERLRHDRVSVELHFGQRQQHDDSHGHGPDQRHDLLLQHSCDGPGRRGPGFTLGVGSAVSRGDEDCRHLGPQERRHLRPRREVIRGHRHVQ